MIAVYIPSLSPSYLFQLSVDFWGLGEEFVLPGMVYLSIINLDKFEC